ncbi:hypothetical protein MAQ5080_01936 [Marinomonas aquimarina]|uniref:Uncharacterized protein n=1 Tax=Marinomonas aquimarina TaxID=295068 RepID=A0A1A8TDR8_9GAMM|nr:hypothetical protein [Marinomonas aquimarina]SBS31349.1 hypothetical protein MAQ5080_01936 [Marinomonas aquimarina]
MPKWLRFLMPGRRVPSVWLLRPLSLITAYLLAAKAPELQDANQRMVAYVGLSAILLWCFIWLVWHLKDRLNKR